MINYKKLEQVLKDLNFNICSIAGRIDKIGMINSQVVMAKQEKQIEEIFINEETPKC